jgi:hypothetical protein
MTSATPWQWNCELSLSRGKSLLVDRTVKPNWWVLLRQFARCHGGEAELFGRHWPRRIRARGDFAPNDVDVTT